MVPVVTNVGGRAVPYVTWGEPVLTPGPVLGGCIPVRMEWTPRATGYGGFVAVDLDLVPMVSFFVFLLWYIFFVLLTGVWGGSVFRKSSSWGAGPFQRFRGFQGNGAVGGFLWSGRGEIFCCLIFIGGGTVVCSTVTWTSDPFGS